MPRPASRHARLATLLALLLVAAGLGVATLPASPAAAGGWDNAGGVTGAYRGGVFQDTATADGLADPLRLDTGDIGGFLVQGAIFWTSPTPPASSGPAAELTLVPASGDGPAVTIPSSWGLAWNGQYYYRAQLRDTGIALDTSYRPTGLTPDARVSAYAVVDGADVPRTWVAVMPHVARLGRDPYTESLSLLPEPPPTSGTAFFGAMRPGTGSASVRFRDGSGLVSTSGDLAGRTHIATSFPVTRGAGSTTADYTFLPTTEPVMQLYVGIEMAAPEPAMSGEARLVRRGTDEPATSAVPGDELDLLVTLANGPGEEPVDDATVFLYEPWPTGLGVGGWSVDPATSAGVTATSSSSTVTAETLAPGQRLVARAPVRVLEGPGAGDTAELTATAWTHWTTRFGTDSQQLIVSADLLPNALPTLQVLTQPPGEWVAPGVAEVTYHVHFDNLAGPDALTSGEVGIDPPAGASAVSIETVGPLACVQLTCRLTEPLGAGTGTTAVVTARVPAPGTATLSATATWSPDAAHPPLDASADAVLLDTAAPTASWTTPERQFTTARSTTLQWDAADTGSSGLDRVEVQQRSARFSSRRYGAWTTTTHAGSTGSATLPLPVGHQSCARIRSVDRAGNTSPWTRPWCAARPLDDRALAADADWRRVRLAGRWQRTATVSSSRGAMLRLGGVRGVSHVAVLATSCPRCGTVDVHLGAARLGRIELGGPKRLRRLVVLPSRVAQGRLRLVVRSSGRAVEIDGVGFARS